MAVKIISWLIFMKRWDLGGIEPTTHGSAVCAVVRLATDCAMGLVKQLLDQKVKSMRVHSIVSALCIKYDAGSKKRKSEYILTGCDTVSYPLKNQKRVLAFTLSLRRFACP